MVIAMLSAEYPPQPGGVGDYTRKLSQALVEQGQHVLVFTIADCRFQIVDLAGSTLNLQSTIDNLQSSWGWQSWRDVRAALARTRPDILHIQYQTGAYGMHPAINFLPWRLRRAGRRPAIVVTAHDLLPPYLFPKAGPLRQWVTCRLLTDADAVVVTNEADRSQIAGRRSQQGWGINNTTLIPIGSNIPVEPGGAYDRAAWRARLRVGADETLLAYFGLISRSKGLDTLLDALASLPARFRLLVVGGAATAAEDRAYADAIRQQIGRLGLEQRVTITGHCSEAEVSAHLLAADIAALPFADGASFRRGSLLAALAHGLPTITTLAPQDDRRLTIDDEADAQHVYRRSSIVHRRLLDGENVLLVPPADAPALAGAIERLARDPRLRERLVAGGRALAAQFSWDAIAQRHVQLYEQLVEG